MTLFSKQRKAFLRANVCFYFLIKFEKFPFSLSWHIGCLIDKEFDEDSTRD